MAQSVTVTINDLKLKIADLLMECAGRSQVEDALRQQIVLRDQEIAELTAQLEAKPPPSRKTNGR